MLTGLSPRELGVTSNCRYTVPANSPSFIRELRDDYGYNTALLGKTHWTPHEDGVDLRNNTDYMDKLGLNSIREIAGPRALAVVDCELTDIWKKNGLMERYRDDLESRYRDGVVHNVRPSILPDHLYPDLWLGNVALDEIDHLPFDRPWFLWVSFPGPHEPFDVPLSWRGHHGVIPDPVERPRDDSQLEHLAPQGSVLRRKLDRWPEGIPKNSLSALRSDYADHLHLLDVQLGRLISRLGLRPDMPSTAITICSDHGELLGDWGLLLKGCFLEGATRSLFIHSPPGGRNFVRRLWQPVNRSYGLTPLLWAAYRSVVNIRDCPFGAYLRQTSDPVKIEFEDETLTV